MSISQSDRCIILGLFTSANERSISYGHVSVRPSVCPADRSSGVRRVCCYGRSAGRCPPTAADGRQLFLSTGWRRINRTIQPFNRVYENLHIMTHLTLVAHKQIRRQKRNRSWKETKSRKNRKTAYIVERKGKTARVFLFGIVFIITFTNAVLLPILSF